MKQVITLKAINIRNVHDNSKQQLRAGNKVYVIKESSVGGVLTVTTTTGGTWTGKVHRDNVAD